MQVSLISICGEDLPLMYEMNNVTISKVNCKILVLGPCSLYLKEPNRQERESLLFFCFSNGSIHLTIEDFIQGPIALNSRYNIPWTLWCVHHTHTTEMTKYGWNQYVMSSVLLFNWRRKFQFRWGDIVKSQHSLSQLILDYWIKLYGRYTIAHLEFRSLKVHHNDRYNFAWICWVGNLYLVNCLIHFVALMGRWQCVNLALNTGISFRCINYFWF